VRKPLEARSPGRSTKSRVERPTPARWNAARLFANLMQARSADRNEENPRRIRFETAGTLVSLHGQAALGNRFPKRFGNDLPAHFPTEAHPLESPAVAGPLSRSRRARAGGSSVCCRVRASQVFPFSCEEWVAGFSGSASESLTVGVLSSVAILLGRRSQPPRRAASRCWRIACRVSG